MAALTLDDKPWWVGLLLGLVLAVAAVAAVHYTIVSGIQEEIASAESQIADLDKKIEQGRAAERKLPQFREEVKRLELELEKLRRILPSTRNTEEIIKKVKSLVDQGDFALRRLTFPALGGAKGDDPYAEWPISISLDGRYHDLAILFNRLGNFSRIMNVENITITALGNQLDRTITSDFTAKTFVYIEPGNEEDAAASKSKKKKSSQPGGEE
ncbi:MAG TPA: type 4a pilus biogenesis protein PilO [Thermoanaerobaculia bacterium]|nr:type 4a pilus biogenesis protein PilO [Thermoanaerobaculia bacterium]